MHEPHAGPTPSVARTSLSRRRPWRTTRALSLSTALAGIVAAPIIGAPTISRAQPAPPPPPPAEPAPEPKPEPKAEPAPKGEPGDAKADAGDVEGAKKRQDVPAPTPPPVPPPPPAQPVSTPTSGFSFGSYGRVISGGDLRGRPGRDNDLVARGSRLDESNYVELELRRDDYWAKTNSTTRVVATLALQNPIFHYNGVFDAALAIRNLYIEESDLGLKNLSVWAGSRMYRGDDAYLLDFWPLDNLNTLGGGVRYEANEGRTQVALHAGTNQPGNGFFKQSVERELPFNQLGSTTVDILNRQRFIGSARLQHVFKVGHAGGIKLVGYGEGHALPAGQREIRPETFQDVEEEAGFVVGGQVGGFTGERSTHVNLFVRYASGLAAFGELGTPNQLGLDKSSAGASELLATFTGNFEAGPFALMAAGYVRSFRNASPDLDYGDLDEAIIIGRPHLFFGEWGGLALEASYQVLQRGVLVMGAPGSEAAPRGPATGSLFRFGVVPFLSPSGRGSYARPHIRFIYLLTARDEGARAFYPQDDTSSLRDLDHFFGFGAEWWFNNSWTYGGKR